MKDKKFKLNIMVRQTCCFLLHRHFGISTCVSNPVKNAGSSEEHQRGDASLYPFLPPCRMVGLPSRTQASLLCEASMNDRSQFFVSTCSICLIVFDCVSDPALHCQHLSTLTFIIIVIIIFCNFM